MIEGVRVLFFSFGNLGTCDKKEGKWYYEASSGQCTAFSYSGCEGNANRFESEEHCDRQCGQFKDQVSKET